MVCVRRVFGQISSTGDNPSSVHKPKKAKVSKHRQPRACKLLEAYTYLVIISYITHTHIHNYTMSLLNTTKETHIIFFSRMERNNGLSQSVTNIISNTISVVPLGHKDTHTHTPLEDAQMQQMCENQETSPAVPVGQVPPAAQHLHQCPRQQEGQRPRRP